MITEEYEEVRTAFLEAVSKEKVTIELLHRAMDCIDVEFDRTPSSLGWQWIADYPGHFLQLLTASDTAVTAFFKRHLQNPFVQRVLYFPELLGQSGDTAEERLKFVRTIWLAADSAPHHRWLQNALKVGISEAALARLILEKLERSQGFREVFARNGGSSRVSHEALYNQASDSWTMAQLHAADAWQPNYWLLLSNSHLLRVVMLLVDRAPQLFFSDSRTNDGPNFCELLAIRLGEAQAQQLLNLAGNRLQSLEGVSERLFARLPAHLQLAVLNRVPLNTRWILWATLRHFDVFGDSLLQRIEQVDHRDYLRWWRYLDFEPEFARVKQQRHKLAIDIEKRLLAELRKADWKTGTLQAQEHRGEVQLGVHTPHKQYVNKYQESYPFLRSFEPQAGDEVLFHPGHAERLTPSVSVVKFFLVNRP
ncbi:MAG TPA: hypothetical protein VD907_01425 [Verrucomicrobiae bacterium]|nr:hypothetical protein [Verrucomicrobiae bacterium]